MPSNTPDSGMSYLDGRLGFVDQFDQAWTMDDYGNLIAVSFSLPHWFWQEV